MAVHYTLLERLGKPFRWSRRGRRPWRWDADVRDNCIALTLSNIEVGRRPISTIVRAYGCCRDLFTTDDIQLSLQFQDGVEWSISESWKGFASVCDELEGRLGSWNVNWFGVMARTAFYKGEVEVYPVPSNETNSGSANSAG